MSYQTKILLQKNKRKKIRIEKRIQQIRLLIKIDFEIFTLEFFFLNKIITKELNNNI